MARFSKDLHSAKLHSIALSMWQAFYEALRSEDIGSYTYQNTNR